MVQPQGGADDRWFEGVVHDVRSESVGVQFARSFRPSPGSTFSVRFTFNRVPLRRQHQALHRSFAQGRVLFPIEAHVRPPASQNTTLALFNNTILTNPAQLLAVKTVLALPPASHPFIIFGPYVHPYRSSFPT
jgi:helicase MOV-10